MGTVFLRNNSWVIEYKLPNGKYKRKSIGKRGIVTKTFAKEVLKGIELKIKKGEYDLIDPEIPFLDEFIVEYINHQRYVKQIRSLSRSVISCKHFSRLMNNKKLSEYTPEEIDLYKDKRLSEGVKLNTIARELVVIRSLFNQANKWKKFFGTNPVSESGIPKVNDIRETILSFEEERKLLDSSPEYLQNIINVALNTAMREGEILGLQWEWIDFKENIIQLPQTNTKSKKILKVPINEKVRKILLKLKLKTGGYKYVFESPVVPNKNISYIYRSFKTACRKANIDKVTFHDLRHTSATRLVEAGVPLHTVSKLLGHSSVTVTERYSHPEQSVKEAVDILENIDSYNKGRRFSS